MDETLRQLLTLGKEYYLKRDFPNARAYLEQVVERSQAFADSTSPGTCCAVTWVEFMVQPCRFYCRSRKLRLCHPVLVLHACRARRRVVYNDLK